MPKLPKPGLGKSAPSPDLRDRGPAPLELDPSQTGPARVKRALRLPLGIFGLSLIMEMRFFSMLLLSFFIYLLGALVANEYIYLLASGILCCAAIGAVVPLLILCDIKGECSLPGEVLSSEGTTVVIKLSRRYLLGPLAWMIPSKWLRLTVDVVRRGKDGKTFERVLPPEPVLIENLTDEKWFEFPTPLLKRGVYLLKGVEISTCFPLGIVWWARRINVSKKDKEKNVSITVYPRVYPMAGNFLPHLRGISSMMGLASHTSKVTHQSTSFRSVREYRAGDSLRHVHWPSVARKGEMLVKEFDQETLPVFDLLINLRLPYRTPEQFELAVATALSLCHLGYNKGQLPNLFINPPIGSKELEPLMHDLPENINPGIHLYSEILSRVEPISSSARSSADDEDDSDELAFSVIEKDVLTLIPTTEQVMKYNPGQGDIVCNPLELAIIPPGWDYEPEAEEESKAQSILSFAASRKSKGRSVEDVKKLMGPTVGEVIARIEWEKDLESI